MRAIRLFGDPVLRTPTTAVTVFDARTRALAADLLDTVGLPGRAGVAAPQIGVAVRAFAWSVQGLSGVVFNPVLAGLAGSQDDDEGCLSMPGRFHPTPRAARATVTGLDALGAPVTVQGEGLLARCLQHETDHLDGRLFLDRLDREVRRVAMRALRARTAAPSGPIGGGLPSRGAAGVARRGQVRVAPAPHVGAGASSSSTR